MEYAWPDFCADFNGLWKTPELQNELVPQKSRDEARRRFFDVRYGESGQQIGLLHMKLMTVLADYALARRPHLATEVELTPDCLLHAVHFLVQERGIENPTAEQIEAAESAFAPKN